MKGKIHQVSLVSDRQILVMLCGDKRFICLKSVQQLRQRAELQFDTAMPETKNAISFTVHPSSSLLCVALRDCLLLYELPSTSEHLHCKFLYQLQVNRSISYIVITTLTICEAEETILWYGLGSTLIGKSIDRSSLTMTLLKDTNPPLRFYHERATEILCLLPVTSK